MATRDSLEGHIDRASYAAYVNAVILAILGLVVLMSRAVVAKDLVVFGFAAGLAALGFWVSQRRSALPLALLTVLTAWIEGRIALLDRSFLAVAFLVLFGGFYLAGLAAAVRLARLSEGSAKSLTGGA